MDNNCKYRNPKCNSTDYICDYYKNKVEDTVPTQKCNMDSCPILHPDLLKGLTMLNK